MLPLQKTPSKADAGIEHIKKSLSAKWGIQLPATDPTTWSPSKRDLNRVEDRIVACIQFLYFKRAPQDGALDYALNQFEENAVQIISKWRFKPHGEAEVLPSLEVSRSALKQDFLRKRPALSEEAITELTEYLKRFLETTVDRVKAGKKFPKSVRIGDGPDPTNEVSPTKPISFKRQSSLGPWLRSESELGPAKHEVSPAQQPLSSVDYLDYEMADLLANADVMDTSSTVPTLTVYAREAWETAKSEHSSSEDTFETPPTSPLLRESFGLGVSTDRKRSHPDSMQAPPPRVVSRKTSNEKSAQESIYPHLPRQIGPTRAPDRASTTMVTKSQHDNPRQPAQNKKHESEYPRLLGSFGNTPSLSSSMTSVSSAWTSPNTSFSARSLATSFDASVDGTDATIPGWDNPSRPSLSGLSISGSESDVPKWLEMEANKVSADKTRTLSDPIEISNPIGIESEPSGMDRTAFKPESTYLNRQTSEINFGILLANRLTANSPFVQVPCDHPSVPFRQLYEITRVAIACKLDVSKFLTSFKYTFESYDSLWSSLGSTARAHGARMPERSSLAAWDRAGLKFEGVSLTGELRLLDQQNGACIEFHLHPLKLERSYRLSRQFGSDRFCVLALPGLGPESLPLYLKQYHTSAREVIIKWLVDTDHRFLGRTWRAFYTKPNTTKKKGTRTGKRDSQYHVYLFAEDGVGFRDRERYGEADPRLLDRPRTTVRDMIEWFMPFKTNENESSLKLFARLKLGVSPTIATVEFSPKEIFRADDARADTPGQWRLSYKRSDEKKRQKNSSKSKAPVMNDGCARISKRAAKGVADCLGLDNVPCVFQGRIGGAKGVWMIDAQDETPSEHGRNYWIEITDSQLKFQGHAVDDFQPEPARVTFEVNDWAKKLSSGSLNFQLVPILVDRGVPPKVIARLLEQDLAARVGELEVAMDSGLALRNWNQEINPITEKRARYGGVEMQGGLPLSRAETINWFTEHGFHPKTCGYLKDQLYKAIQAYCLRLESKMRIEIGQSTYAYMIADPLAMLEEGEIHLGFSSVFHDTNSGFGQSMLHNVDVLVARSPAYLPSDVQKVRAVFKPELMMYRDVVVFPSKGSVSLASKLSGGDYDGDEAWVCWDPDIVQPFRNADVPSLQTLESYGIEKDSSRVEDFLAHPDYTNMFLRHAFNFNLQGNMLGICSIYYLSFCYREKAINSPRALSIAALLGNLVDSAKGGFQFDQAKWNTYLKNNNLPGYLPTPAYKDPQKGKPSDHLIDHLVFVVAKGAREMALSKFDKRFTDTTSRDDDLFRLRNQAYEDAKSNKPLAGVLKNLETELRAIHKYWSDNAFHEDADDNHRPTRKPDALTFRALVEHCRSEFLALTPTRADSAPSDLISHWQRARSSHWDLLKASVAFHLYHPTNFIWHVAGVELGEIKATARGMGAYRCVVADVYAALKVNRKFVGLEQRGEVEDGGEDEFGDWDWDWEGEGLC